jgi:endonuclease YncB( thermonuclease family)
MKWILAAAAFACLSAVVPAVARADPCEGRLPGRAGETFAGTVRYIGDGDSLCLGPGMDPATWIEVRLSDFDAPELHSPTGRADRDRLSRLVRGRVLDCVAVRGRNGRVIVYDRVIASCRLNGRRIGDLLRAAGGREGGN